MTRGLLTLCNSAESKPLVVFKKYEISRFSFVLFRFCLLPLQGN